MDPIDSALFIRLGLYLCNGRPSTLCVERSSSFGPWRAWSLGKAGGCRALYLRGTGDHIVSSDQRIDDFVIDDGYRALMLVHGGALVGDEYVDEPGIVVIPPGGDYPVLYEGAEAILMCLGRHATTDSQSRMFFSAVEATGLKLAPTKLIVEAVRVGTERTFREVTISRDLGWYMRGYIPKQGRHSHTHGAGGEIVLILAGEARDGNRRLRALDFDVSGPGTEHAPENPEGYCVALTLWIGR